MALVGEAHIIVRAITTGVERDIRNGFQNIEGTGTEAGRRLGAGYGSGFLEGYRRSKGDTVFKRLGDAFRAAEADGERARRSLSRLVEIGYVLGPALMAVVGGISAVVVGLGMLIASALGAASALAAVGAAALSLGVGFKVAGMALKGVGAAVNQAGGSGQRYTKTLKEMREELQQLRFDAEEAAISEKEAALNLEKARLNLLRMQDLPPNSIARREAEIEYERAEFAYRKAKDRRQDLQEEAEKGIEGIKEQNKVAASGADPYSKLTPSQKKFVDYLRTIQGRFKELRETAAAGFLPGLQTSIETLMAKAFPNLQTGVGQIASAMGGAAIEFANVFTTDANQEQFSLALKNIATNITGMGTTFGNFGAGFTRFFNLSQPLTERFNTWVGTVAKNFDQWTIDEADGIQDFLERAGDAAAIFGDIFKNVFGGIGGIINEALQPDGGGIDLLKYLRDATAGFKNIGNDPALAGFLSQAGATAQQVFSIIGKLISSFLKLAGDPNVTEFFRKINEEFPTEKVDAAISALSDALPVVADVFNNLVDILATIAASPATKFFFDTLKVITDIGKFLAPVIAALLFIVGPIFAIVKAIMRVGAVLKFLGLAFVGAFNLIKRFFNFFKKGTTDTKKGTDVMNKGIKETKRDVEKMAKATGVAERAFKKMNTALQKLNTTLKTFGDRSRTAATSLNRVKDAATKTTNPMSKLKTESDKAGTKLKKVKTEGDKAKTSLDKIKKSAQDARTELGKLGKTKTAPSIGVGGGGAGGAGGGGGALPAAFIGGAAGGGAGGILKMASGILKSPIGKFGLPGLAVAAIGTGIGAASQTADAARVTTRQMEALAKANGGFGDSAKQVSDRLVNVADSMGAMTGQNYENVKSVQALLLQYPDLATEADVVNGKFDKMTGLALDMANVLGTDGPTAARLMADALAEPEGAMDTFTAAGVRFTDQEKLKYDTMVESNDIAGAQDYLLRTLTEKYGGYAASNTDASDKIAARFDTIGRKISEGLQPLNDWISRGLLWLVESIFGGPKSDTSRAIDTSFSNMSTRLNNNPYIGYRPGSGAGFSFGGGFANGGTIYPSPGGTMIQVAEAGRPERVEPLNADGTSQGDQVIADKIIAAVGTGITMNVYASPDMDVNALANVVGQRLGFTMRKGGR
jgi:methyl-accepting chemotaxis protein